MPVRQNILNIFGTKNIFSLPEAIFRIKSNFVMHESKLQFKPYFIIVIQTFVTFHFFDNQNLLFISQNEIIERFVNRNFELKKIFILLANIVTVLDLFPCKKFISLSLCNIID